MARPKNYEVLIRKHEELIAKAKEKVAVLESELDSIKKEQKELEVSDLYDVIRKSGCSVSDIKQLLNK